MGQNDEIYWWRDAPPEATDPDAVPAAQCDVAIVGAGYTGLSAALTLARAGRSVQVFDRDVPGYGASTRNGGITSGNLRLGASEAKLKLGRRRAEALFGEGVAAREYLAALIAREEIACDYTMQGRFTGVLVPQDLETMRREADVLHDLAGIETQIVEKSNVPEVVGSQAYVGGSIRADIGTIQPAKLHQGLLAAVRRAGGTVLGETPVRWITRKGDGFHLRTARGVVQAGEVIMATNGYTDAVSPWLRRRVVPVTSRIVVTEELGENVVRSLMPEGRAMGEKRRLYRYFRPTPDGKRILLGAREPALPTSPAQAAEHVRQRLVEIFPEISDARIECSWGGKVAFTRHELPTLFTHEGIHYAVGYCGSGTVWAPWLGHRAAMAILEPDGAKSPLHSKTPGAIPFFEGRPWFLPAVIAYHGVRDAIRLRG